MPAPSVLDDDARTALREILDDPSLPVGSTLAEHEGVDGRRIAALREAHDYIIGRRLGAAAARSADAASFVDSLATVDEALATTLRWHSAVVALLVSIPGSRARNAVLGDVHRGELITWASSVRSWSWQSGSSPGPAHPVGKVNAEIETDEHPALYDAIVLWEKQSRSLVVVPTHREGLTWEPVAGRWSVRLNRVSLHVDEVIPWTTDPRALALWPQSTR